MLSCCGSDVVAAAAAEVFLVFVVVSLSVGCRPLAFVFIYFVVFCLLLRALLLMTCVPKRLLSGRIFLFFFFLLLFSCTQSTQVRNVVMSSKTTLITTLSVVAATSTAASWSNSASEFALPIAQKQQTRLASGSIASMPRFSWDTLPVFFHSANSSGPWSEAAVAAIAKFPMATFEKDHAFAGGYAGATEETLNPAACRRVAAASNGTTSTVYYLNSAIDWPSYALHQQVLPAVLNDSAGAV